MKGSLSGYPDMLAWSGEGAVSKISNLRNLNIILFSKQNELKKIDVQALTSLPNLSSLDLSHNQIKEILTLNGLNLKELFLQGNKISKIEEKAFNMPQLVTLNLNFNDLSELPENVFDGLTNLKNLTLCSNLFESVSKDVFQPLSNLVKLHLDSNGLKQLPEGIAYLKNLQYL